MAIRPFTQGPVETVTRLNELVNAINKLNAFIGDGLIKVIKIDSGYSFSIDVNQLNARLPKGNITAPVRRAITTEAAPAATNITCNLYDSSGQEITSGEGSAIEVYCSVIGGGNLSAAVPRLEDNDDLFIVQLPYNNGGTAESRWYCLSLFQASQDCEA